jgi:hypothetical protein
LEFGIAFSAKFSRPIKMAVAYGGPFSNIGYKMRVFSAIFSNHEYGTRGRRPSGLYKWFKNIAENTTFYNCIGNWTSIELFRKINMNLLVDEMFY